MSYPGTKMLRPDEAKRSQRLRPRWDPHRRVLIAPDGTIVGRAGPQQQAPAGRAMTSRQKAAPAAAPVRVRVKSPMEQEHEQLLLSLLRHPALLGEDQILYRWANPPDAGAERLAAAQAALSAASQDLGLGQIQLRWFTPMSDFDRRWSLTFHEDIGQLPPGLFVGDDMLGRVDPAQLDTVWLRADTPLEVLPAVALHESRHLWQIRSDWTDLPMSTLQRDADDYAREMLARLEAEELIA